MYFSSCFVMKCPLNVLPESLVCNIKSIFDRDLKNDFVLVVLVAELFSKFPQN